MLLGQRNWILHSDGGWGKFGVSIVCEFGLETRPVCDMVNLRHLIIKRRCQEYSFR